MEENIKRRLQELAAKYNNREYFKNDPISFPRHFLEEMKNNHLKKSLLDVITLADIEISGILAAHLAWGRRDMIVRDCTRMFDQMKWQPYNYVMNGDWKNDDVSLHRTIKWSEFAGICSNIQRFYKNGGRSFEELDTVQTRCEIYGQKPDHSAANKKINMYRRWMVRDDGIVDLGIWKKSRKEDLIIPLDVHVHRTALELGLTKRNSASLATAMEITDALKEVFPGDPCLGDFALFAYAATQREKREAENTKEKSK